MTVLTTTAVAELLDCEAATIMTRAQSGDLPGLKIGRSWVFPQDALMQRLNEMALEDAARRRTPKKAAPIGVAVQPRGRRRTPPALPVLA